MSKGFSLTELLVTLSIMAVLSALGLYVYSTVQASSTQKLAAKKISLIIKNIKNHIIQENGLNPKIASLNNKYFSVKSADSKESEGSYYAVPAIDCSQPITKIIFYPANSIPTEVLYSYKIGAESCIVNLSGCYDNTSERYTVKLDSISIGNPLTHNCFNKLKFLSTDIQENMNEFKLLSNLD